MEIQLGNIYINKTKKYLLPCLKEYGEEFINKIENLFKLGIGIGDFNLIEMGITLDRHIFILVDTNLSRKHFNSTIKWLRSQEYFAFDYSFDDIHNGHLHMIVIKLPEKYHETHSKFTNGKFSEMYSSEDLEKLFSNKEELKIFKKDEDYKVQFVSQVNEIYWTNVDPVEWTGELDFPINESEEIFNKKKLTGQEV